MSELSHRPWPTKLDPFLSGRRPLSQGHPTPQHACSRPTATTRTREATLNEEESCLLHEEAEL